MQKAMDPLFERIGGHAALTAVVDRFYDKVLADDRIQHFFTNIDMEAQRRHQTAFLMFALGGVDSYPGRSMERAHAGLNLQPEHFQAVAEDLVATLQEFNVSPEDVDAVVAKLLTLKDDILYK